MRTRRFDTLTYARSGAEAEDITLFDRKRQRNIAVYASQEKRRGAAGFYNEDDLADYDVLDYDIERRGDARPPVDRRPRAHPPQGARRRPRQLTLRLADSLVVHSIVSDEYGRLFSLRVRNQNTMLVNLPTALARDTELTLTIAYGGRLAPQAPERETDRAVRGAARGERRRPDDAPASEPSFLYSSRSYWYPQAPVTDYATARIRITVPVRRSTASRAASCEPDSRRSSPAKDPAQNRKSYVFTAAQPLRYLAFIVSRFARAETTTIAFGVDERRLDAPSAGSTAVAPGPLTGTVYAA